MLTDYIKDIFRRMELNQICSFLLNGTENLDTENSAYRERLKNGSDSIYKRLENLYVNEDERDEAGADLAKALSAHEEVYTEIGMKFGARIFYQLLMEDDPS